IADVTTNQQAALDRLNRHDIDLVIVIPRDVARQISSGSQAQLPIYFNEVDPLKRDFVTYATYLYINELNKQTVAAAASQGQQNAGDIRNVIQRMRNSLAAIENRMAQNDPAGATQQVNNMQKSSADAQLAVLLLSQVLSSNS